jgi:hypothetical protein
MTSLLNRFRPALVAGSALLSAALTLCGQTASSLRGTVVDPQGAVIPEVVIALVNNGTGSARQTLTDATGVYQFLQMAPGEYTLTATKVGFDTLTESHVKLLVNTPASLDLKMAVGKTTETVNVSAEAQTLNTVDASVGNTFNQNQIRELPLDTRNIVQLLSLEPGVTSTGEVMGSRRDQNNITLDGVDVNDNENSGIGGLADIGSAQGSNANGTAVIAGFNSVLPIPLDSVQEFRVTVAGQGADEGRSSGGQVVLVTKSGTNQLHGSLYEYNRNTDFAANSWFNNRSGVDRTVLNRNQFGASLGGPIKKDRFFFFFNYERRIDASQLGVERAVPTESLKAGNLVLQGSDGNNYTLTPSDIQQIDPLHIGVNQAYLNILKQYPVGNDPAYGADGGLAFTGFRFNAPDDLDDRVYVGKMDVILTDRQTLSFRGTLSNSDQDNQNALAQFPGQAPASVLLNDSKGLAATYTAVLRPNLVNSLIFGYTRQGISQSGVAGAAFGLLDLDSLQNYNARAASRILPVPNIVDNLTWTKSKHTITTGVNFRLMTNNRSSYANSYPSYGFATTVAVGLGEDIQNDVTNFLQTKTGNTSLQLANPDAVATAMGILLGLVNNTQVTYQFDRNGNPLAVGAPSVRGFRMDEYEGFVNDSWRATPELTLTLGLRYSNDQPPYEIHGLQVNPNIGLDQYFAQRLTLGSAGVPSNAMPNAYLSYSLGGPVNGKPSWYGSDDNNFGPRLALAYAPKGHGGLIQKIFGNGGVFRMGGAILYDRYGSELITQYDQFGSFGLSTTLNNPVSYNFTTSPRYDGSLPAFPAAPTGGFPYTPPDVNAISGEFQGIYPDLKSPYSILLNASFARELPGKMTMEVSYNGRLSRKLLLQGDVYTPLENFKDPASGETWLQSMTGLRNLNDAGITPNAVMANPSLVPNSPFIQDLFPALNNFYFPGSASANYFYGIYGVYGGSYLDILHALDRIPGAFGTPNNTCASLYGCFTFFSPQGSSMPTWMNAGDANYHAMTVTLRRSFSVGMSFDVNYTWSHSIDNASAAEGAAGQDGAVVQNIFNPSEFRGSSDFDIRQQINANVVYELPVGKGKPFLHAVPGWANQIIGGWQVSTIMRLSSGLPTVIQGNYTWNTNYWQNSLAIATGPFTRQIGYDNLGNPSLFANVDAYNSFADQFPGQTGTRAIIRLAPMTNFDIAVAKSFPLPWEGHRVQFRAEAYNAFNTVNFTNPSIALYNPSTFGEFQNTMPPRELQFGLRYEF